ncbi:hypothetical protein J2R98_002939 [Alkalibacillus filiformis]|uniref:Uncharacterized protein n=1 Tax=Alkalibacillus filiformis TaxID=200990 RepID=A0ABU0DX74_9BACI|nr:hypothetical protein [Alkalibacillus filiformis]MDQ0353078.1 hypothetical protein [Alkalibacillus filiformis]
MKKSFKKISFIFAIVLITALVTNVSAINADSKNDEEVDALDREKEVQKTLEQTGQNLEEGLDLKVGEPLTVEFDDGSSITHEITVEPANSDSDFNTLSSGQLNYAYTRVYEALLFGRADIKLHIEDARFAEYGQEKAITVHGPVYQSVPITNFATVDTGATNYKYVNYADYTTSVRARARGDIVFNVSGVTRQQSYDFAIEVNAGSPGEVSLISHY